jgi:hypothetical protein
MGEIIMLIELLFGIIFFVMPIVGMFMTILLTGDRTTQGQSQKQHGSLNSVQRIASTIIYQDIHKVFKEAVRHHPSFKRHTAKHLHRSWLMDTS